MSSATRTDDEEEEEEEEVVVFVRVTVTTLDEALARLTLLEQIVASHSDVFGFVSLLTIFNVKFDSELLLLLSWLSDELQFVRDLAVARSN